MLNNVGAGDKRRKQRVQNAYNFSQLGLKRVMQKIVLHIHIDKEQLRIEGEKLGLSGDELKNFMHFTELAISVAVDTKTGKVSNVKMV